LCRNTEGTYFNGTDNSAKGDFGSWSGFNAECMAEQTNVQWCSFSDAIFEIEGAGGINSMIVDVEALPCV
jgi:hypothetical protein